ncbi:hypothetical protein [Streptomyces sp. NPDC090022]|uniref:hypothetical protein n=1 Tax=Streptomyces sp. NPDC090022 TaxID=3365920 RepID=UPI0038131FF9
MSAAEAHAATGAGDDGDGGGDAAADAGPGSGAGPGVGKGDPGPAELAERVFSGPERWGWEFVAPPEPPPHPAAHTPPVYAEPSTARVERLKKKLEDKVDEGRKASASALIVVIAGVTTFLATGKNGAATVAVTVLALALIVVASLRFRLFMARRRLRNRRTRAEASHRDSVQAWQRELDEHRAAHLRASEQLDTWFPLALETTPSRVDVFGGTGNGWASLLTSVGGPLLSAGQCVVVLDLTQQTVALELALLASGRGIPVGHVPLPGGLLGVDLSAEFTPEELAEALAETFSTMRPPTADVDLHTMDVDLVQTVATLLPGPLTFARLAAGLRALLGRQEPGAGAGAAAGAGAEDGTGPLTPAEAEALARAAGSVARGERAQDELRYVRAQIDLIARAEQAELTGVTAAAADWWQPGRLTLLTTEDLVHRRKDLADRFAFFRLLHTLRKRPVAPGTATVVIAGADHLGRQALESMARQARAAGVRLVLLLEHLREAALQVAGGSDSATVFMRLGNGEEARAAAQFIGQEHKFLVSRLTRQSGETFTESRGTSYGAGTGRQHTAGTGGGTSPGRDWGASRSFSTALSRSWQQSTTTTATTAAGRSATEGETLGRVYEFTVEPVHLQGLPVTGLVLVESGPLGRRVSFGDCNPGIAFLPRLSARPRTGIHPV